MKAYIGIKYYDDYRNKEIIYNITLALEKAGYKTSCIVRDIQDNDGQNGYSPNELMKLTFNEIDECDLVIIDLSEKGVGLGIEVGYAFARGIPVITIAKRGSNISETLEGISEKVFIYDDIEGIKDLFSKKIL
ncbi:hypothetical protein [Tissierella praeacuta]|uniref:hypothetical protein n=1 Tax=Tissierella praeacuta TaxID=43131 RepID=UPI003341F6B9